MGDTPSWKCGKKRPAFESRLPHDRVLLFPDNHVSCEDDLHDLLEPEPEREEKSLDEAQRELLYSLSPYERGALEMRIVHGWTYQRIGEAMGMTRQGAYKAYVRAMAKMRGE